MRDSDIRDAVQLSDQARPPCSGGYQSGFEPVARCFDHQVSTEREIGAGLTVYHHGECVVDLWGGHADLASRRLWQRDSRIVVFSVTKGFAAMALHLLADRGLLDWDMPVASYWPEFAANGKEAITVRTLVNHEAGLPCLDTALTLEDFVEPSRAEVVLRAIETQRPVWTPGEGQGYHALTFGMYVRELFERIAHEPLGPFLRRELFEPLGSDVWLGAPESEDEKVATLYPPPMVARVGKMLASALFLPRSTESRVAHASLRRRSVSRRAFLNPGNGPRGIQAYNDPPVRRASLAWASATASAHGVARAYLPFASGGEHGGTRFLKADTLMPVHRRQGWSSCDAVLQKPLGWSQGFLKEERHLFSPHVESFGHAGMGGALGWCDPVSEVTVGYVMNRMDWHVRPPRAVALCRALYECEPLR